MRRIKLKRDCFNFKCQTIKFSDYRKLDRSIRNNAKITSNIIFCIKDSNRYKDIFEIASNQYSSTKYYIYVYEAKIYVNFLQNKLAKKLNMI